MKNIFGEINFKRVVVCTVLIAGFFVLAFASYSIQKKYYSEMEDNLINQYFAPAQKMQAQYFAAKLQDKAQNVFSILKASVEYRNLQEISATCSPDQKVTIEQIAISLQEGVNHLILINDKGVIICSTLQEMEGKDISALSHIQEQLASKKPVVSRLFVNPLGEKLISFTAPIFSLEGEYRGALGAGLNPDFLKQLLSSSSSLVPGGYNSLNDDNGTIIYHSDESFVGENFFGEKMQEAIRKDRDLNSMYKKMMAGETGYDFYTFRDDTKVAGYAPASLFDGDRFWSVASTANLKDYMIFTEPFFTKGLVINLFLILGAFILIILAVYYAVCLRERERERE